MPPLFRRSRPLSEVDSLPNPVLESQTNLSPIEFIANNKILLDESIDAWSDITQNLSTSLNDERRELVTENLRTVYSLSGSPASQESFENEATRLTKLMGVFSIMTARHMSGGKLLDGYRRGTDTTIYEFKDTNVGHLLRNTKANARKMQRHDIKTAGAMRDADFVANNVLFNVANNYAGDATGLMAFVELYQDGAADMDPRFAELRQIITADWLHYDPSESILKNICANLRANPAFFVEGFLKEVVNNQDGRRLTLVKTMARFAVAAAAESKVVLTEIDALRSTYQSWPAFPDLQAVFQEYADVKIKALEAGLAELAAPDAVHSIRLHRSREEVEVFKRSVYIHYQTDRLQRRAVTKARLRNGVPVADSVFRSEEIIAQVLAAEAEQKPRAIKMTKSSQNGVTLVDVLPEDIAKNFVIKQGNGLERDVCSIVNYLRTTPLNAASTRLRSGRGKLTVNGSKINLWRFAPNDAPNLDISSDNRFYRIVYAVVGQDLILVDILDHDSFDKKYT